MNALLLGAATGAGLWMVIVALLPPRPTLAQSLAAALAPPEPATPILSSDQEAGWSARWGRPLAGPLATLGLPRARVRADLAVLGRPAHQHLAEQATAALVALVTPPLLAGVTMLAGVHVPLQVPAWAALGCAVVAFCVPDLNVRAQAAQRRADFRHALSAFLDLVVISLAAGAGVDGALDDACGVGRGWAFDQLRRALAAARWARVPPWQTLARLGDELGVTELSELAASVSLAGSEGARVRSSLAAKAAALRAHQLNDAETAAASATERMSLPVVALFGAFLLFITFPALNHVLSTL